jgi:uncharacterized protein (TIGR03437 family)
MKPRPKLIACLFCLLLTVNLPGFASSFFRFSRSLGKDFFMLYHLCLTGRKLLTSVTLSLLVCVMAFSQQGYTVANAPTGWVVAPSLQGEAAVEYLKQQGLYSSLRAAVVGSERRSLVDSFGDHVGANISQDSNHMFVCTGVSTWVQQRKLNASDGVGTGLFGSSIAISGQTAVIGAYNATGTKADQGAVYVFVRSGTTWTEQAKLVANDGAANDYFGIALAISGDTVVVGATGDDIGTKVDQGSAYIFVRSGSTWTQQQKITASDGAAQTGFGRRVAISGETVVVGHPNGRVGTNDSQGAVYVFVRSGTTWTEQQKLVASDGEAQDSFGFSVAVSGGTVVVGAPFDSIEGNISQGSAYVLVRSGATWSQQQKLNPADGAAYHGFGISVAIEGETAIVGAAGTLPLPPDFKGAAYVFVRSGVSWSEQQKLTAKDGVEHDRFGWAVAISGEVAVVAAYSHKVQEGRRGAAYAFTRSGMTWTEQQKLIASDGSNGFSLSLALSGGTAIVGAQFDDVGGNTWQGSAYVFTCPAITLSALPGGTFGAAYSATITALPIGSYAYSVTAGALPPGLTLSPAGVIAGRPTMAGTFNFTVTVSGEGGSFGIKAYSFVVAKAGTTLTVAPPASAPTYGQVVTFTATVSSQAAGAAPTSAVTFSLDNGVQTFLNVPLVNGKATLTIPVLSAGAHTVGASYAGDANYSPSAASPASVSVGRATLIVKANDATKVYGAALPAFTASYAGFVNGETAGVLSGSPSLTTSATQNSAAGTYPITAAVGTLSAANYAFTFQSGTLTVTQAASTTALASSPNPSIPGQSITLSATVTSAAGAADGQVEFFRDGTSLGKVTLAGGAATLTLAGPHPLGSRTFTASYLGSTNFTGSSSPSVTHVVSLPCEMSLNPSGRGFTEAGGFATEKVTVSGSCDWQATSNAAWIMVTGYSVSNSTVDYTVAPLTTGVERTGTITVGNQTFTVFQKQTVAATSGATFIVGGLEIRVRDSLRAERLAPLFFVSPTQVNYLIPKGTAPGGATVTFLRDGRVISTSDVTVARLAPGVFSASQTGSGPAAALVQRINGAAVSYEPTARYDPLAGRFVALPISFGGANEHVFLLLYGTGLRGVTVRDVVTATVGGAPVDVTYAGAQGQYEGLDQINLRLTPALAGKGLVEVKVTIDGKQANAVQVHLQ